MNSKELPSTIEANLSLGVDIPNHIKERLDACLIESDNPERIADAIMFEFRVHELEKVIAQLVSVYDKAPKLLHEFWQRSSDACPLEVTEAEEKEKLWFRWVYKATRS